MSKRLVPHTRSPAADPLPDELVQEVFVRLPPEPRHLLVASLVCKRWRRLIRDRAFLVRFRAFHRATPVLGFYQNIDCLIRSAPGSLIRFGPIAAPAPRLSVPRDFRDGHCWVLDCRHGRVLIYDSSCESLYVWDPMAAESFQTISVPVLSGQEDYTAALVCTPEHDDHTDCHSSPFRIVYVDNSMDDEFQVSVCVFSSEADAWGDWSPPSSPPSLVSTDSAAAVVGGSVYWKLNSAENTKHILGFEMQNGESDLIELPTDVQENYTSGIYLMPAEDGGIGFAGVKQSCLHFWSRKPDHEGRVGWARIRMINMEMLHISDMPAGDMLSWSSVVGFADDSDVLFLRSEAGVVFTINLRSMQLKKVPRASGSRSLIYPYTSFYTRGRDIIKDDSDVKYGTEVTKENEAGSCSGGGRG